MLISMDYKPEACVSDDTTREVLNQVEVDVIGDSITLVATDGHCLIMVPARLSEGEDIKTLSGPIDPDAFDRARKLAKARKLADYEIKLSIDGKSYIFSDGSTMPRILRLPGYSYPDYKQVTADLLPKKGVPLHVAPQKKGDKSPKPPAKSPVSICFNIGLLNQIATAIGAGKNGIVRLTLDPYAFEATAVRIERRDYASEGETGVLMLCRE